MGRVRQALIDASEYLEDPNPFARELFGKQRQMAQVKEYDANGYRVPSSGERTGVATSLSLSAR